MSTSTHQPRGAHLVGSVPLQDNRAVFAAASSQLGNHLRRIPDGETGERLGWISWQNHVFVATPQLEVVPSDPDLDRPRFKQVKLRDGYTAADITFGDLGYSAAAIASYAEFSKMKADGLISAECRFQVCLPTPLAPIQFFVAMDDRAAIEPWYEAKMLAEIDEIVAIIPASELAIQWDTVTEFGMLEGVFPSHLENLSEEVMTRLVRLGDAVPEDAELGYHLCYGDNGHKHFKEPLNTEKLVGVANGIAANIGRPLNWIHMPVPVNRDDVAFFQPLEALKLPSETELYLGLVHMTDGVDGANRRIRAAKAVIDSFGVATECGFGRRPAETVPELMKIHAMVSATL